MTAYLISLAIVFLVAITLFDGMSRARKLCVSFRDLVAISVARPTFQQSRSASLRGRIAPAPLHASPSHYSVTNRNLAIARRIDEIPVLS